MSTALLPKTHNRTPTNKKVRTNLQKKQSTLKETERVATINAEGEGETRSSRLQNFISSLFASIGGVFAPFQEETDMDIASKVILPQHQLKGTIFFTES